MDQFDIIIIGAGPIGLACALEAKRNNLTYLVLEKGALVNSLYNYPVNMTFFSTSERLEIGGVPFVSNNSKPTRSEALEYYRRVAQSNDLNIKLFCNSTGNRKDSNRLYRKHQSGCLHRGQYHHSIGLLQYPLFVERAWRSAAQSNALL